MNLIGLYLFNICLLIENMLMKLEVMIKIVYFVNI